MIVAYINLETKKYPCYQGDIRLEHPEIGEVFECPATYAPVYEKASPIPTVGYSTMEVNPEFVDGRWQQSWKMRVISDAERKMMAHLEDSPENRRINQLETQIKFGLSAPNRDEWERYAFELDAYKQSWPRSGVIPTPPKTLKMDKDGNVLSNDLSGSTPNVIG